MLCCASDQAPDKDQSLASFATKNVPVGARHPKGSKSINQSFLLISLGKKVFVLNLKTNEESIFNSYSQAEKALEFPKDAISLNLKSKSGAPYPWDI